MYKTVSGHVLEGLVRADYPAWGRCVRCSDSTQRTMIEDRNGVQRRYVEVSVQLTNELLGESVTLSARTPQGVGSKINGQLARWDRVFARQRAKADATALRLKKREEAEAVVRSKRDGTTRTNLRPYDSEVPKDDPVVYVRLDPESPGRARVRRSLLERIARGASPALDSVVSDAFWGYVNCQNESGSFLGLRCRESPHKHRVAILTGDQSARTAALVIGEAGSRAPRTIENRRTGGVRVRTRSGAKPLVQVEYCGTEEDVWDIGKMGSGYVHRWPFEEEPYLGAWVTAGGTLALVVALGRGSYQGPTRQLDEFIGGDAIRGSVEDRLRVFGKFANGSRTKQPWSARDHIQRDR